MPRRSWQPLKPSLEPSLEPPKVEMSSHPPVRKKAKRHTVYNACKRCQKSKVKVRKNSLQDTKMMNTIGSYVPLQCSGAAPCARCVNDEVDCVFIGRAQERAKCDLQRSQDEVATLQRELHRKQRHLESAKQEVAELQRDLTTSQLDLLACHQHLKMQQSSLASLFVYVRTTRGDWAGPRLSRLAQESENVVDFVEKVTDALCPATPSSCASPASADGEFIVNPSVARSSQLTIVVSAPANELAAQSLAHPEPACGPPVAMASRENTADGCTNSLSGALHSRRGSMLSVTQVTSLLEL